MFVVVYPPGLWRTLNLRMFALFFQRVPGGVQSRETQQMKVPASLIRNFTSKKLYRAAPPSKSGSKEHSKRLYQYLSLYWESSLSGEPSDYPTIVMRLRREKGYIRYIL